MRLVRVATRDDINRCPDKRLDARHYRDDGSCRCAEERERARGRAGDGDSDKIYPFD